MSEHEPQEVLGRILLAAADHTEGVGTDDPA